MTLYDSADYLRRRLEEAVPPQDMETVLASLRLIADQLDPERLDAEINGAAAGAKSRG